jgi:hypothetical protein
MKWRIFIFVLLPLSLRVEAQTAQDLFQESDVRISYLGIDFSHVRLIGNFAEFFEAGEKNVTEIRDIYFQRWNRVVVNEREKYDLAGMLRQREIFYDIDMITGINARTPLEEIESLNAVKYTEDDIRDFVSGYDLYGKEGLAVVFIAESLSKSNDEAFFHFVVLDTDTKKVLFQRRLRGEPNGFGLRNYWINSLYRIINDIKYYYFNEWKYRAESGEGDTVYLDYISL